MFSTSAHGGGASNSTGPSDGGASGSPANNRSITRSVSPVRIAPAPGPWTLSRSALAITRLVTSSHENRPHSAIWLTNSSLSQAQAHGDVTNIPIVAAAQRPTAEGADAVTHGPTAGRALQAPGSGGVVSGGERNRRKLCRGCECGFGGSGRLHLTALRCSSP